ncbi:hypothetical protein JDV02_004324 [Purpureocillium takamizusanense]|nr:uncharacterized protein JDV02_004324 [Purpureocillium takamizusanense]UNI18025.1 hypothetical protein JDV02_004324 [Purpureocillium takamizusanense]
MFLIEGDGKAILYTGDVRCEPWFVNSLVRNPLILEYASGLKTLDKIYLDTSFTSNLPFQSKSEGISELLRKVAKYPAGTVFHFQAWTYGYEDVWLALSKALKSPIHVDDYKMRVYSSLRSRLSDKQSSVDVHFTASAASLVGHMCGNTAVPGCLTADNKVRLHSCERGNMCPSARDPAVVSIRPVVAHLPDGSDLVEAGVGGGGDDLKREVELNLLSQEDLGRLIELIAGSEALPAGERDVVMEAWKNISTTKSDMSLKLNIPTSHGEPASLESVVRALTRLSGQPSPRNVSKPPILDEQSKTIYFPYSRHSSYPELCHLVGEFGPKDVWPCTVDRKEWIADGISIASLFGKLCSESNFEHDNQMALWTRDDAALRESEPHETQELGHDDTQPRSGSSSVPDRPFVEAISSPVLQSTQHECSVPDRMVSLLHDSQCFRANQPCSPEEQFEDAISRQSNGVQCSQGSHASISQPQLVSHKRKHEDEVEGNDVDETLDSQWTQASWASVISASHSLIRREAHEQMLENADGGNWRTIALLSTDGNHTLEDEEL